jgi:adenylate cyclase
MAPLDLLRIVLGLGIPTLLIGHAVGTRLAWEMYRQSPQYARVVWSLWATDGQGRQLALLAPGWLHGCLGIHLAFAQRPLYRRLHRLLFAAALLLPVLGGLGFLAMGKELAADLANRGHLEASIALPAAGNVFLQQVREDLLGLYLLAIASVFAARAVRAGVERRFRALVSIEYPQRTVRVPRGWTVLEASRSHHLAHVALCGGRARCSTCRVRVTGGEEHCPPAGAMEQATLARIDAGAGIRLACQLRPDGDIAVVPLLRPRHRASEQPHPALAVEQEVVLVCVDWRNREAIASTLLPHDAVFLSRLFANAVATAILAAGGIECDPRAGGTIAVFGIDVDLARACRSALSGARRIERALSELSDHWEAEFGVMPDFAICVHAGSAALGEIGSDGARRLTAAGPAIDTARRLRAVAARKGTRVLLSVDVLEHAGAHPALLQGLSTHQMPGAASPRMATLRSLEPIRAAFDA